MRAPLPIRCLLGRPRSLLGPARRKGLRQDRLVQAQVQLGPLATAQRGVEGTASIVQRIDQSKSGSWRMPQGVLLAQPCHVSVYTLSGRQCTEAHRKDSSSSGSSYGSYADADMVRWSNAKDCFPVGSM